MKLSEFNNTLDASIKDVKERYQSLDATEDTLRTFVKEVIQLLYTKALDVELDLDLEGNYTLYYEHQVDEPKMYIFKVCVDLGSNICKVYKTYSGDITLGVKLTEEEQNIFKRLYTYIIDVKNVSEIEKLVADCTTITNILKELNAKESETESKETTEIPKWW